MRRAALAAVLLAVSLAAACHRSGSAASRRLINAPVTITTTDGKLHGRATVKTREFLGVRYAQPPVGPLRWALPKALTRRASGVLDATKPGARCAQGGDAAVASTAEDCLFLNVVTPRKMLLDERLPVMVWWPGSTWTSGAGSYYDPERLVTDGDVIVVTVNRRLGIFGYLGVPGLDDGGSFGFADGIEAVRWVKANAASFGGDPNNITVFGQSDGGSAACALLTTPIVRGLVERVAISSGSCLLDWPVGALAPGSRAQTPYASITTNRAVSLTAAKALGCEGAEVLPCLRKLPAATLVGQNARFANQLTYGTTLLPDEPTRDVATGHIARIPVLSGFTHDEARAFVGKAQDATPGAYTAAAFPGVVRAAFGPKAVAAVSERYPPATYGSPAAAFATAVTDVAWACPTDAGNQALDVHTDLYAYEFDDSHAPDVNAVKAADVPQAAAHGSDLPYLFDLGGKSQLTSDGQRALARTMVGFWTSFARSGQPSAAGAPDWYPLQGKLDRTMNLTQGTLSGVDVAAEHHCTFWHALGLR